MSYRNEEVNCTEPSPSVSVPCRVCPPCIPFLLCYFLAGNTLAKFTTLHFLCKLGIGPISQNVPFHFARNQHSSLLGPFVSHEENVKMKCCEHGYTLRLDKGAPLGLYPAILAIIKFCPKSSIGTNTLAYFSEYQWRLKKFQDRGYLVNNHRQLNSLKLPSQTPLAKSQHELSLVFTAQSHI